MYKSIVVGFDAREMWLDGNSQWTQETKDLRQQKDEIFLRQDVTKPLSVDHYIWHSVFSELTEPRLWLTVKKQTQYTDSQWNEVFSESRKLSEPDNYTPRRVWQNLTALQDYLQQAWGDLWKPCYVVAVVEIMNELDEEDDKSLTEGISPNLIDSKWQLLGYEVADFELISGLFEGIVSEDELAQLRREWKDYLNEYHLFTNPQKAFDYIHVANTRYPSHMPYYVYALYLIDKHNTN